MGEALEDSRADGSVDEMEGREPDGAGREGGELGSGRSGKWSLLVEFEVREDPGVLENDGGGEHDPDLWWRGRRVSGGAYRASTDG